ncbi:MAG: CopG family transcriptional regulator [Chloroflexi bacterium]|nr:CopG family transcriptional regulator [Chloroflexota bacterium]
MVRTQIQLAEEQAKTLKEIAAHTGVSMSELIRQSVDQLIRRQEKAEKWRRAVAVMGRYSSGLRDVSISHDKYLGAHCRTKEP